MTNEQYLIVSYFAAAGGGVAAAVLTGVALTAPLRHAIGAFVAPVRRLFSRTLFVWLILAGLLAFLSVGYFGQCDHQTYRSIVDDYPWLVQKNHEQAESICLYLAIGVLTYSLVLAVMLILLRSRRIGHVKPGGP